MKKILKIVLSSIMVLSLVACSSSKESHANLEKAAFNKIKSGMNQIKECVENISSVGTVELIDFETSSDGLTILIDNNELKEDKIVSFVEREDDSNTTREQRKFKLYKIRRKAN